MSKSPSWHNRRPDHTFVPAISSRPTGARQGDSKVQHVKQGVRGAFRGKNIRLLLGNSPAPENLAVLAEVPLDRLQLMADGALCSDETAYHLEQQLRLPTGWMDRDNSGVPGDLVQRLKNPDEARLAEEYDDPPSASVAVSKPVAPPALAAPLLPAAPPILALGSAQSSNEPLSRLTSGVKPEAAPGSAVTETEVLRTVASSVSSLTPTEFTPANGSSTADLFPREPAPAVPAQSAPQTTLDSPVEPDQPPLLLPPNTGGNMSAPNDLRRQNLAVLLMGKGAKSALARLLNLSPASVTSMLNGTKALDKEFCNSICHALKLPENWFETEKKEGEVSDSVLRKLAPLPRGSAAPAPVQKRGKAAAPAATVAEHEEDDGAAAGAAPTAAPVQAPSPAMPKSWPAGSKVAKVQRLMGGSAAEASTTDEASQDEGGTSLATRSAPSVAAAPSAAPTVAEPAAPTSRAPQAAHVGDTLPGAVSGFVIEAGLPPITEALIKTLAQKARLGSFSEDAAFSMLGTVRTL